MEFAEDGPRKREEEGVQDGGQENDTCINVRSDSKNRIEYIRSMCIVSNSSFCVNNLTF
jgi:hypothetical protein